MNILLEIYDRLYELNVSERNDYLTDVEYSERWLGLSKRYFSCVKANSDKKPSLSAVLRLACRIKQHHAELEASNLHRREAQEFYPLVQRVWNYMYERGLA